MPDTFEMVDVDFGPDTMSEIEHYLEEQLEALIQQHKELHDSKLPKWRKLYLGTPSETSRNFPFPNAANTIVQVIGETVDTMVARVMGLIFATHPLWVFQNYALAKSDPEKIANEAKRRVIQDFMDLVGFEPAELDLHLWESLWFTDAAKLGTAFMKISLEEQVEAVVLGYESASRKRFKGAEEVIYSGPKVTKLRHEDVLADPKAQTLALSNMVVVRKPLSRFELEERGFTGRYEPDKVEDILYSPDRATPRDTEKSELMDQGISSPSRPESTAEWDIYECYFPWWAGNPKRKYRLIYTYHKKTRTVLRKVFNFLPKNDLPVKRAKLGYRTDGMYGHGYAELLEAYQEELSTTHNQRLDNATVANIRALRVSPRARALDANMELYPSAILVGDKDDIEAIAVGDVYPSTFKNEEATLSLVARRAGITPAVSGAGTGGMMKKPQVYSSQATLAVMQENNSVVGFATAEFRHAHAMLGSSLAAIYGRFGTGGREEMFGIESKILQQALSEFERNQMRIPIRSSTGSLNKEIDKQTGMLMAGLLQRHYTAVAQLIQSTSNPMVPPEAKAYFAAVIVASNLLHKRIIKDFGYDQPDIFVPEPQGQGGQGQVPQGPMAGGGGNMGGAGPAPGPGGAAVLPRGGMETALSGLAPVTGGGTL